MKLYASGSPPINYLDLQSDQTDRAPDASARATPAGDATVQSRCVSSIKPDSRLLFV